MSAKIKIMIMGAVLLGYVVSSSGCLAAWFLAGAGAGAATAAVASREYDKKSESKDEIK